ncbi:unnamed protein product [Closterium sp. NIES-64]|nr:unnamed protein product [Closterium sp. NIES-64]
MSHGKEPFLIGVSGGTASGKTTVCEQIIQQLHDHRVVLVHQDSFYRGLTEEELKHANAFDMDALLSSSNHYAFDTDALLSTIVALKEGQSVEIPVYDFKTHQRSTAVRKTNSADVIVLEGILVFHDARVRALMNMKIFVDTDADVRLARRIRRDTLERGRDVQGVIDQTRQPIARVLKEILQVLGPIRVSLQIDVQGVIDQYARFVKPAFDDFVLPSKKFADIIIPRGGDNHVAVNLIVQHIGSKLGQHDLRKIYSNVRGMHTLIRNRDSKKHSSSPCLIPSAPLSPSTTPLLCHQVRGMHTLIRNRDTKKHNSVRGMHTLIRNRDTKKHNFVFYMPHSLCRYSPPCNPVSLMPPGAGCGVRGMHTLIRNRDTKKHNFVFYADRLIRLSHICFPPPPLLFPSSSPPPPLLFASSSPPLPLHFPSSFPPLFLHFPSSFLPLSLPPPHHHHQLVEHGLGHLPFTEIQVTTPTGSTYVGINFSKKLCGVSIIRSGESMENALRACCKGVKIGKILIHREGDYGKQGVKMDRTPIHRDGDFGKQLIYEKLPRDIAQRHVMLLDPVLASGRSAIKAIELLLHRGVPEERIIFLNLISAPEGIHNVCRRFPHLKIVTSEIDSGINEEYRVVPGMGEFGDRYFGTEEGDAGRDDERDGDGDAFEAS